MNNQIVEYSTRVGPQDLQIYLCVSQCQAVMVSHLRTYFDQSHNFFYLLGNLEFEFEWV